MKDVTNGKFTFVQINSERLRREMYRLRYRVYVEECHFERPEEHLGGLEMDEYDAHSIHLGALDAQGTLVGTCRIVLPSYKGLPIQHAIPDCFPLDKPLPLRAAEISRLAILPPYRRRIEDGLYGIESYPHSPTRRDTASPPHALALVERRRRPVIILGLYRLIYQVSKRLGLTHWYMISEEKLWRILDRYNLLFRPIGPAVDYHGLRVPYLGTIKAIEQHLAKMNPTFYASFIEGLLLPSSSEPPLQPQVRQSVSRVAMA